MLVGVANQMRHERHAGREGQLATLVIDGRNNASDRHHPGCSGRRGRGVSGERPLDREAEVRDTALSGDFAAREPEARQVPLPLRKERNETMGLLCSQVVEEGVRRDRGGASPQSGAGQRRFVSEYAHQPRVRLECEGNEPQLRSLRASAGSAGVQDGVSRIGLGNESSHPDPMDEGVRATLRWFLRGSRLPNPQRLVLEREL